MQIEGAALCLDVVWRTDDPCFTQSAKLGAIKDAGGNEVVVVVAKFLHPTIVVDSVSFRQLPLIYML